MGSFYIGGKTIKVENQQIEIAQRNENVSIAIDINGDYAIESIYVQYFIPQRFREIFIMIHGGGHTGSIWENTPDGREGWLHLLLAQSIAVYIIDSVERGRAGWCSIEDIWLGKPELRSYQRTWSAFRLGSEKNFAKRIPYANQQFPIEAFDTLIKYNVPRWNCNVENSASAVSQLIKKIGRCSLVAHSQGADIAMRCVDIIRKRSINP